MVKWTRWLFPVLIANAKNVKINVSSTFLLRGGLHIFMRNCTRRHSKSVASTFSIGSFLSQNSHFLMSNIPFSFRLPSAWLVAVLSEWLDMPSIGMLDTAMTSKTHRSQFLNCLQNMRSTTIDSFSGGGSRYRGGKWTGRWWRWLSVRQVHVESIVLHGKEV